MEAQRLTEILMRRIGPAPSGRYRHWDRLRHLRPPDGLTHEEWWLGIKFARSTLLRNLPLLDKQGNPFQYTLVDPVLEALHQIDREGGGPLVTDKDIVNPQTRDRYVQSSLIEEAITSSQLEGAATTREVAKEMLRSGRRPIDRGERMILNNHNAMKRIGGLVKEPLTPDLIYEIHRQITDGTLPDDASPPYIRKTDDGIGVYDDKNQLLHMPPAASEIPRRMERLCKFANQRESGAFLHPVLKAIVLHFCLAYDHPFIDGNGRTARALFYWSVLSQGFWQFEFISISTILRRSPARYARAFLYTETDDNDLTYFMLYHLEVIRRSIDALQNYLAQKASEVRDTELILRSSVTLNHRQIALLSHALRHPGMRYTIESHQRSHRVVYETARTDLIDLADRGVLDRTRSGRAFVFAAPHDLSERLRRLRT
jgi:Fic family protein